jgi:Flp pilus assembly protein TadG
MKTHGRRERGQDLVEYALVLPIMMLILMTILDLGRAVYYYSAIHNSAREGVRYGIIYPDDPAGIEAVVRTKAVALEPAALTVMITNPDEDTVQVTVTYQFTVVTPLVAPLIGSNEITLGSRAAMRIEG